MHFYLYIVVTLVFDAKVQQKLHIRKFFSEFFAYVRQDATVATGEFLFWEGRERENQKADVRSYCFFLRYASVRAFLFDF